MAWNHVSASQVETFQKCARLWWLKSVLKAPEPQRGPQAMGETFHLIMEKVPKGLAWPGKDETGATDEEWVKAETLARIALPLLPPDPGNKIMRELEIKMDTYPGGPLWVGYIDLAIPPGVGWPALMIPENEAIVGDYKTTSDFRYMKTPEELANSVQMMSYAKWSINDIEEVTDPSDLTQDIAKTAEEQTIRLVHLYARTKPPFGRSSIRHESALVTIPQINSFWGKTLDIVREMEQVSSCGTFEDVEATGALTGHCEAYGGCHFRDKCGIAGPSTIKGLFQITKKPPSQTPTIQDPNTMSGSAVLNKILAARAAASGQSVPATQPVAATSTTPTVQVSPVTVSEPVKTEEIVTPVAGNSTQSGNALVSPGTPKPATGPVSGLMAKISSTGHGKPALTGGVATQLAKELGTADTSFPGEGMRGEKSIASIGELIKYASGIVPPDAPARTQDVIIRPGDQVIDPLAETPESDSDEESTPVGESTGTDSGTSEPVSTPVGTSVAPALVGAGSTPEKPQARRGRPTKEESEAKAAAEAKAFNDRVEAEVAKRMSAGGNDAYLVGIQAKGEIDSLKAQNAELGSKIIHQSKVIQGLEKECSLINGPTSVETGCTLYIDCFPVKGKHEAVDFYEWIQPIATAVAVSNNVADYRLIQYNSKGLLASHIRELVKAEGLPRAMTIPSYAAGADVALEILTPLAKSVIRKLS